MLLDSDIVLVDTFEGQIFLLHKDLSWASHEMLCKTQDIRRQSSREETNLNVGWQELENVLDLWLETSRKHLISLIQNEELEVVHLKETSSHHVMDTTGGTDHDMLSLLKNSNVFTDDSSSDAGVDLCLEILSDRVYHEGNLHRKFSRWRDDQYLCVVACGVEALQG